MKKVANQFMPGWSQAQIDAAIKSAPKGSTHNSDPLVRYSRYGEGPFITCDHCGLFFTHLGINRHINAAHGKKTVRPKMAKVIQLKRRA